MWYVEVLIKTYNAGDRTFYDAIKADNLVNKYYSHSEDYVQKREKI